MQLIRASAEAIPLFGHVIDTVVIPRTLCSIPDALKGPREIHRVLKPSGELLFVEHGRAFEPGIQKWEHRFDPIWTRISCHLDRPVDKRISQAAFGVEGLKTGYLPRGAKPMTFLYEGQAHAI